MSSQSQVINADCSNVSKTVSFVLPGRRTLSENLPSETVDIPISLAQRSSFLRTVIEQHVPNRFRQTVRLDEIDPLGFRFYIEWLQKGHVEFNTTVSSQTANSLRVRDCFDLIFAHIVGTQFEEPHFQDYIMDIMLQSLDPSQTPDINVLEVVFLEKGASTTLQRFVVDIMFAVERKMLNIIKGLQKDPIGFDCQYHVHEAGKCYRDAEANPVWNSGLRNEPGKGTPTSSLVDNQTPSACFKRSFLQATAISLPRSNLESPTLDLEDWCRDIYGFKPEQQSTPQYVEKPHLYKQCADKPLPKLPPLEPPGPLFSEELQTLLWSRMDETANERDKHENNTYQLVLECLNRLYSKKTPPSSELKQPSPIPVPTLVLECLERFNKAFDESSTRSTKDSINSMSVAASGARFPNTDVELSEHTIIASFPSCRQIVSTKDYGSMPQPYRSLEMPDALAHSTRSSLNESEGTITPLIKRKPVPARGIDWLKQYDRINPLTSDKAVVVAKRSKASRFKEMLRSESSHA